MFTRLHRSTGIVGCLVMCLLLSGCGTIKGRTATDQLLVSDAVDQSIQQIDFSRLAGARVFLDTTYLRPVNGIGFVNSEYILSSLRERMVRSHCKLQDQMRDADFVVEVRVGALGTDSHEVNYGIPGSQAVNQTASLISSTPMPAIPEISLARKDERRAAAKIAIFAYHRESREPVWETGAVQATSLAKSTWIFGVGPFQKGHIYESAEMAASPINMPTSEFPATIARLLKKPLSPKLQPKPDLVTAPDSIQLAAMEESIELLPVPATEVTPSAPTAVAGNVNRSQVVLASGTEPIAVGTGEKAKTKASALAPK